MAAASCFRALGSSVWHSHMARTDQPSVLRRLILLRITCSVAGKLRRPITGVSFHGPLSMPAMRAAMPETAMDEEDSFSGGKYDIWATGKIAPVKSEP